MITLADNIKHSIHLQSQEMEISASFSERAIRHLVPLASAWKQNEISVSVVERGSKGQEACLAIVQLDRPFVVSSLRLLLNNAGMGIKKILHPVINLNILNNQSEKATFIAKPLSLIFIELERPIQEQEGKDLAVAVIERMKLIKTIVKDFKRQVAEAGKLCATLKVSQGGERGKEAYLTLSWLLADNFIFLGYDSRYIDNDSGAKPEYHSQGIIKENPEIYEKYIDGIDEYLTSKKVKNSEEILFIDNLPNKSPVHRDSLLNVVIIIEKDDNNQPIIWHAFFGLWTSSAVRNNVASIPFLANKIQGLKAALGLETISAARKNFFLHCLSLYPWAGFVRSSIDELKISFNRILQLVAFSNPRVVLHKHLFLNCLQVFILLPRERYNPDVRVKIIKYICNELNAELDDWHINIGEGMFADLTLNLTLKNSNINIDIQKIENGISLCLQRWEDTYLNLTDMKNCGNLPFPEGYRAEYSPIQAYNDTELLYRASKENGVAIKLEKIAKDNLHSIKLTMALIDNVPSLLHTYPMLQRMALPIEREEVYAIDISNVAWPCSAPKNAALVFFTLESSALTKENQEKLLSYDLKITELLKKVWLKKAPNDNFNSLIWKVGITFEETLLWRAMSTWLRQTGVQYSANEQSSLLSRFPEITSKITEIFIHLHDPKKNTPNLCNIKNVDVDDLLKNVSSSADDRLFRDYLGLVLAIKRTNFFTKSIIDPIAFKIATQECEFLKHPRPFKEIFVEGKDFVALHMRMGVLARGGLRWSDRLYDFRDEVLGLVKAQNVKNVVIVPSGAKGGFVLKRSFTDNKQKTEEAIKCYKQFISILLDMTDNQTDNGIIHPKQMVCRDGTDPYLVVAADKGTASFSDYANEVAVNKNFWLGDAFASGGSQGYDHKIMGITARGAWESVKQHCKTFSLNPEKDEISVVGIGDMSGDVFGNGMLLSKTIKLIAAFNHRHIFINPEPDASKCYLERKRLFALPASSWSEYDKTLLSKGAIVADRSEKRIKLTAQIKKLLGISNDVLAPNKLIQQLLKLDVDLIWLGGIGTYIKAKAESHLQVSDPINNPCRIDSEDLRCKVIGEGANLGITQKARIIFAKNLGHINTDSIDNSAGVNCSDHEVNIKILLSSAIQSKALQESKRNEVLRKVETDVANHVLLTNQRMSLAVTLHQIVSVQQLPRHRDLIQHLVVQGKLNREIEFLPDDSELERRISQKEGLTRPEIVILLSYAKMDIEESLRNIHLWDWQSMPLDDLYNYFPKLLRNDYSKQIKTHPLAGDIFATELINECLNIAGCSFLHDLKRWLGYSFSRLVQSYVVVRKIMGFDVADSQNGKMGNWYDHLDIKNLITVGDMFLPLTAFFAVLVDKNNSIQILDKYLESLPKVLKILENSDETKIDDNVATRDTCWFDKTNIRLRLQACYIINEALEQKDEPAEIAKIFIRVGEIYGFDKMALRMSRVSLDPVVEAYTRISLLDRLYKQQTSLSRKIYKNGKDDLPSSSTRDIFLSVVDEINRMKTVTSEQMILWQQAVDKHLDLS